MREIVQEVRGAGVKTIGKGQRVFWLLTAPVWVFPVIVWALCSLAWDKWNEFIDELERKAKEIE